MVLQAVPLRGSVVSGGFVKLDSNILDSSIWAESAETRIVWLTMLAMADSEGMVRATAPGIARSARVSIEAVRLALATFEAPDEDSRTLAHDGRRIERVDGGYILLNYLKYRDKDYTAAERMRRYRERQRERSVTPPLRSVTQAEAEAEAKNGRTEAPADQRPPEAQVRGSNFREASDLEIKILRAIRQIAERTGRPAWEVCRKVTSYKRRDGEMSAGVEDPARLGSILARQKALEDAEWWLAELDKGATDGKAG